MQGALRLACFCLWEDRRSLADFEPIRVKGPPLSETVREDREDRF